MTYPFRQAEVAVEMKRCSTCREELPVDAFNRNAARAIALFDESPIALLAAVEYLR